jgi:hypothetical protein
MSISTKEKYLLNILTEIKREIICQDVLKENRLTAGGNITDHCHFTDRTKDKVLTVMLILMGDDVPNNGLYHYRDYSVLYGILDNDPNFSRNQ